MGFQFLFWVALAFNVSAVNAAEIPSKPLVVAVAQEWDIIHPYAAKTFPAQLILQALMKPLVYYNKDIQLVPGVIEKVPTFENGLAKKQKNGELILEIKIRDQAKWGDGVDLTCEDIAFGHQVATAPFTGTLDQEYYTRLKKIEWDPKSPKTCKLTMRKIVFRYNDLSSYFPLPKHIDEGNFKKYSSVAQGYDQNTSFIKDPTNPGLFYGPYVIEEYKLGSHITVKRNPYFYGTKPQIERITFRHIPSTATLETYLLSGEIQMVLPQIGFSFDQAVKLEKKFAEQNKPFKVYFEKNSTWERLYLNTKNPMLKDPRVRQALNLSLDREELNQAFFQGKMETAYNMLPSFDPNFETEGKYKKLGKADSQKAEQLLDSAGWKKGADGWRTKDGKKLSVQLMTTAGNTSREIIQVYIAEKWKKVGVEAVIKNYPARTLIGDIVHHNKHDGIVLLANDTGFGEAGRPALHSSAIPSKKNSFSGLNSSNYSSAKMDHLQDLLQNELNPQKRKKLVGEIQDVFFEDVPMIPLYFRVNNIVAPANLQGEITTGPLGWGLEGIETWRWQ